MKTSMAAKQFHWTSKVSNEAFDEDDEEHKKKHKEKNEEEIMMPPPPPLKNNKLLLDNVDDGFLTSMKTKLTTIEESQPSSSTTTSAANHHHHHSALLKKKLQAMAAVTRLRLAMAATLLKKKRSSGGSLQYRVVGTLFGHRGGHMQLAFQKDSASPPVLLVELATPITFLMKEMASGLVRIVLECEKKDHQNQNQNQNQKALLEEAVWRTFCNSKKCGFTNKRECGEREMKILKALEPVSMGAGVLPAAPDHNTPAEASGNNNDSSSSSSSACNGDVMYMRANFERVVGSRDSEAFYMMNPDCNAAPELSIYLLRV